MPTRPGWIRRFHRVGTVDVPPLLIFPHAGSGASAYRELSRSSSRHFDVGVVQYPGRQDRASEAGSTSVVELAEGAFAEFSAEVADADSPLTVFGHSMGAFVAFEFVRVAEAAGLSVRLLCPSAAVAPSAVAALPPHPTGDEELLAHLAALNGTGSNVLASQEIMRMALPVVRMDYRAFDSYVCDAHTTVAARVHVLGGADDPFVQARELHGWQDHSERPLEVTVFGGGHFYLNDHRDRVADLMAAATVTR